ncbi:CbiX/SirB N-terminal domain-containing protein [Actinoplanes sp. URMC 104]|uniref:CbiX/SirB N-terminal domain-containing protein n=1 Tax=Actinoplanes sp. URMC 104 TaxID=3423409 RepID=UPI003F1B936D
MPTLIAVAHGTRSPAGQAQIRDLVARVAARRPGLDVRLAYVDVQEPKVAEVVAAVPDAVVVPLLLSAGYHVRVDIAEAVAGTGIPVTRPLGPDDVLLDSLLKHLPPADAVVLAAAGSSDPAWRADVESVARLLSEKLEMPTVGHHLPRPPRVGGGDGTPPDRGRAGLSTGIGDDFRHVRDADRPVDAGSTARGGARVGAGFVSDHGRQAGPSAHGGQRVGASLGGDRGGQAGPSAGRGGRVGSVPGCSNNVRVAYVSGPGERVPDVVADLRRAGARRVAVAAYFLADGLFYRRLHQAGADAVTAPLCLDPAVTDLVLSRYEQAALTTTRRRL